MASLVETYTGQIVISRLMSSRSNSMVNTETKQPAKRQCIFLRDACSKILGSDTDPTQIPSQLMAALLVQQHSELQSVQMQIKDAVTELNHIKTNSYKVQPLNDGVKPAPKHFNALYKRADALWDAWTSIENRPSGLVQVPLDTNTISSALALYRVMSLFVGADPRMGDQCAYETVWEVCLKSIPDAAANVVVLADYDGGFAVWCKHYNDDVRELLAVITDPDCPHFERKMVAGKVASSQRDRQTLPALK
jgi:hypothetical protein